MEIRHPYHKEITHRGRPAIVDVVELFGSFEVMTLRPDGHEIDFNIFADEAEAVKAAKAMVRKYSDKEPQPPKPLTGRYAKLRDDIITALATGRTAEDKEFQRTGDCGTCNFDSPALTLPRWSAEKIKQAAKEAGTSAYKWTLYGSTRWVIVPNSHCQAEPRSVGAEAMRDVFGALGYDASMYYQAD